MYWRHAAGDLDRYVVLIRYNLTVLQNQSVSAGHNECVFSSLTPGRLYTVTVETWSGGYVSSISTDGRTCESGPVAQILRPCFGTDSVSLQSRRRWGTCPSETREPATSRPPGAPPPATWTTMRCVAQVCVLRALLTCFLFGQVTLLFNDSRVFPPVAVASGARQHRLTSLTPGRQYKIVVSTFSGPYQRAQFLEGRTGERTCRLRPPWTPV